MLSGVNDVADGIINKNINLDLCNNLQAQLYNIWGNLGVGHYQLIYVPQSQIT